MSCGCEERRQMIAKAARGEVSKREAARFVSRTVTQDTMSKVQKMLNSRGLRRVS